MSFSSAPASVVLFSVLGIGGAVLQDSAFAVNLGVSCPEAVLPGGGTDPSAGALQGTGVPQRHHTSTPGVLSAGNACWGPQGESGQCSRPGAWPGRESGGGWDSFREHQSRRKRSCSSRNRLVMASALGQGHREEAPSGGGLLSTGRPWRARLRSRLQGCLGLVHGLSSVPPLGVQPPVRCHVCA